MKNYNLAVVGATGAVGETLLAILHQRKFPINRIHALASEHSSDKTVYLGDEALMVENLADFAFDDIDIALFSAGSARSKQFAPIAVAAGAVVIDNTSEFRYDADVPLVIPEINADAISQYSQRNIIANPNCSTIQMLIALKPIYDAVGITRINVATYQAVSGTGKAAITELIEQTGECLNGRSPKSKVYRQQIAFNVLPQIDEFQENGYTREEMKMVWETHKIFNDDTIAVNPTCARVPVFLRPF